MPGCQREIYLDNNATTPVLSVAAQAAMHAMQHGFGNPSSSHATGIKAKAELESTRVLARQVIGASTGDIVFTSGATEGIQTSIVSALLAARERAEAARTALEQLRLLQQEGRIVRLGLSPEEIVAFLAWGWVPPFARKQRGGGAPEPE